MKWLLALIVIGALSYWAYTSFSASSSGPKSGVRIGATVEEVEKELGPAKSVLPQMGGELRTYKTESGRAYMLIFHNGELMEIQ